MKSCTTAVARISIITLILIQMFVSPAVNAAHELDVSGDKGKDGSVEPNYSSPARAGSGTNDDGDDGADGRNSTPPDPGQNAGRMMVRIARIEGSSKLSLSGLLQKPNQVKPKNFNDEVDVPAEGPAVETKAKGGGGGRGGFGGGGQRGGRGGDGSDATRYSTGGDGGDGGKGGKEGAGTHGGNSGDGGYVGLSLSDMDTDLLMLVKVDVSEGEVGEKGKHGPPGEGGGGGSGGSSYTWTEYSTESYTDSDGKSQTRTVSTTYTNSGGMSGSTGPQGDRQTEVLHDGEKGKKGVLEIEVREANGKVTRYSGRYDLVLEGYDIVSANSDGIIEPGEFVYLKNLKIRNNGKMPLPKNAEIRLYMTNSKYYNVRNMALKLPVVLEAGETYTFQDQSLSFQIRNDILTRALEERSKVADRVKPEAKVTTVNRDFESFSTDRPFEITFPIEIEPIMTSRSMAAGESSRLLVRVTNISKRPISSAEIVRKMSLEVRRVGGESSPEDFILRDAKGNPINLSRSLLLSIDNLRPGESFLLEGSVENAKNAKAFNGTDMSFLLSLTDVETFNVEGIQDRRISFKVSQVYKHDPEAGVLLIVNNSMSRSLVEAWQKKVASLGFNSNVWDLSYYGYLNLTKALAEGTSLAEDFKRKTVVLLNNDYSSNFGMQQATNDVSPMELPQLLVQAGAGLLIFGKNPDELTKEKLSLAPATIDSVPDIRLRQWKFRSRKPKPEVLDVRANELGNTLFSNSPETNHTVQATFTPKVLERSVFGIGQTWTLGVIKYLRTLSFHDGALMMLPEASEKTLDPSSVHSKSTQFAFFMAMPMIQKIRTLNYLVSEHQTKPYSEERETSLKILSESILAVLALEQNIARRTGWQAFVSRDNIRQRLKFLTLLEYACIPLQNRGRLDRSSRIIMDLIVGIDNMIKVEGRWWYHFFPRNSHRLILQESSNMLAHIKDNFFPIKGLFKKGRFQSFEISMLESGSRRRGVNIPSLQQLGVKMANIEVEPKVYDTNSAEYRRAFGALANHEAGLAVRRNNMEQDIQSMKSGAKSCELVLTGK